MPLRAYGGHTLLGDTALQFGELKVSAVAERDRDSYYTTAVHDVYLEVEFTVCGAGHYRANIVLTTIFRSGTWSMGFEVLMNCDILENARLREAAQAVEKREGIGASTVSTRLLAAQANAGAISIQATGTLESAAGLIGRSFCQSAEVGGPSMYADALTAPLMTLIGRQLIKHGEFIGWLNVDDGLTIMPAVTSSVSGGPKPESWHVPADDCRVRATSYTMTVPASDVVHLRYATDVARPWLGKGANSRRPTMAGTLSAVRPLARFGRHQQRAAGAAICRSLRKTPTPMTSSARPGTPGAGCYS